MNENDLILLIEDIDLFSGVGDDIIEQVVALGTLKKYEENTIIFKEGDPGEKMYIIVEGQVKVTMATRDGTVVLSEFSKGDLFGEMAVIEEQNRTATATSVTSATLLEIGHDEFFLFVKQHPNFAISLLKMISRRLRETDNLVAELGKKFYKLNEDNN